MTCDATQLKGHRDIKYADCRVFIRVFTGTKIVKIAEEMSE